MDLQAQLPARYHEAWGGPFREAFAERLRPGVAILDVGAGRHPTIGRADRPSDCEYVGLDVSLSELAAAGAGAYDETVAADFSVLQDELIGRFDLIISWQVLEHVEDLGAAMVCAKAYLRPGGRFVAMFSASRSAFALVNRILPFHVGRPLVTKIMGRTDASPVFPAYYDRCTPAELRVMLGDWSAVRIVPFYAGAWYFMFSSWATKAYLVFENAVHAHHREQMATHLLLVADR